jgi:hypothetical protein
MKNGSKSRREEKWRIVGLIWFPSVGLGNWGFRLAGDVSHHVEFPSCCNGDGVADGRVFGDDEVCVFWIVFVGFCSI